MVGVWMGKPWATVQNHPKRKGRKDPVDLRGRENPKQGRELFKGEVNIHT